MTSGMPDNVSPAHQKEGYQFGLTLIASLSHSDALERAVQALEKEQGTFWQEMGLRWEPYLRNQRHLTLFNLIRSQPQPLCLDWLPADFPELLVQLADWVSACPTQVVRFEKLQMDDKGTVVLHAPQNSTSFSEVWRRWKQIVDQKVSAGQPDWDKTNLQGENLFLVKWPIFQVFSTIGRLIPKDKVTAAVRDRLSLSWCEPVSAVVTELRIVHYADRTLADIRGEAVLPLKGFWNYGAWLKNKDRLLEALHLPRNRLITIKIDAASTG